jgi:hypothetical protein
MVVAAHMHACLVQFYCECIVHGAALIPLFLRRFISLGPTATAFKKIVDKHCGYITQICYHYWDAKYEKTYGFDFSY